MKSTLIPKIHRLLPLILGTVAAIIWLDQRFALNETKFDELALGNQTTSHYAKIGGHSIHAKSVIDDFEETKHGYNQRGNKRLIVWFGNSQLHAINQMQPGDQTAPEVLFHLCQNADCDVLGFSYPNANLQELFVLYEYIKDRLPIHTLIIPLVMDDLRETGLRSDIATCAATPDVSRTLKSTKVGRRIILNPQNLASGNGDLAGLDQTVQQGIEARLNKWLDQNTSVWGQRASARGWIFTSLYRFRNTVFGVSAKSTRPILKGRYAQNVAALDALMKELQHNNVQILTYIVPIRNDVAIPYVAQEYQTFKTTAEKMAHHYGAKFLNLENLVPPNIWGSKDSTRMGQSTEIDFMHFQGTGHRILAQKVALCLDVLMSPKP